MPSRWCSLVPPGGAGLPPMLLFLAVELSRREPKAADGGRISSPLNKLEASGSQMSSVGGFLGSMLKRSSAPSVCHRGDGHGVGCRAALRLGVRKRISVSVEFQSSLVSYYIATDAHALVDVELEEEDCLLEMSISRVCAIDLHALCKLPCSTGGKNCCTRNISKLYYRMHTQNHCCWHPISFCVTHYLEITCHTSIMLSTIGHGNSVSLLFGTCRRWMRSSLLRFPRFNSKEPPALSSVMHPPDLQLSSLPHCPLPI